MRNFSTFCKKSDYESRSNVIIYNNVAISLSQINRHFVFCKKEPKLDVVKRPYLYLWYVALPFWIWQCLATYFLKSFD